MKLTRDAAEKLAGRYVEQYALALKVGGGHLTKEASGAFWHRSRTLGTGLYRAGFPEMVSDIDRIGDYASFVHLTAD